MKRNPRKVKWTKAYRKLSGKELAEDTTFEMERKRNRPEKYDRELLHKTVSAVQKVTTVREKRQERHHALRMAKAKGGVVKAKKAELENDIHLIKSPIAQKKEKELLKIPVEQTQHTEAMQE